MRIITNEIKKIFNLTNLIIVTIATIIIWNLFIYFEIDVFPNGQPATQHYNNAVYMLNTYGTSVDEDEFEEYKKLREEKAQEATDYLLGMEDFIKAGGSTYEDLRNNTQREHGVNPETKNQKKLDKIHNKVIFEEDIYLFWELDAMDYEINRYENKESWVGFGAENMNLKQLQRQKDIINSEAVNSPLNFIIFENYNRLLIEINMLILISIAIMISPIFIKDNKNKVNYIQYSSKIGRKLFNKKIVAGLISTTIIVVVQLGILFTIYKSNNTYMFWNCSVNSVFNGNISWFDITFGQYIMLSVIFTYILAMTFSTIAMFVSAKVYTYITLIGAQIPILFLIKKGISRPIEYFLLFTGTYVPKYTLPVVLIVLILTSIILISIATKKEVKQDINN